MVDVLLLGFGEALTFSNLLHCFLGVLMGTVIGILPGLGPAATVAMLLPLTFSLEPLSAMIMLAGIYYGAQYGGSTTAILVNLPGEPSAAVTAIDGYQMARKGRSGAALAIAALGSFTAGTIATALIAFLAPSLTAVALRFEAPEYVALIVLGLIFAVTLAHGSLVKAFGMIFLGLLFGAVGSDILSGDQRFTLGSLQLSNGLEITAVAVGLFGISEVLRNLERREEGEVSTLRITSLWPTRDEARQAVGPVLRGTAVGSLLGVLPGGGALLSSFASYAMEKKLSRRPETFGHGAVAGVAGPEAANNAGAQTSFIPLLTLGLPGNAVMAMMIGALMIQGVVPGPGLIADRPDLFWGLIASMWIGNLMLVVLNLPMIGIWVRLVSTPYRYMFPAIIVFCTIGAFAVNGQSFDIVVAVAFGLLGYLLMKLECEPAPFILAFVLGPMLEENFRRAMLIARGDPAIFITRPISTVLLLAAVTLVLLILLPVIARQRAVVFKEED